jgi:hypothetical protein
MYIFQIPVSSAMWDINMLYKCSTQQIALYLFFLFFHLAVYFFDIGKSQCIKYAKCKLILMITLNFCMKCINLDFILTMN